MGLDVAGIGAVADLGSKLLDVGGKIFDRIIPDKAAAQKAKDELAAAMASQEFQLALGQLEINKVEAASTNWFVSGWRPFVGWVCGLGLAYVAILEPIVRFIAKVAFGYQGAFPVIDTSITLQVLLGMLGVAGMRSFEKVKGAAK